jgi:hypothetical protein
MDQGEISGNVLVYKNIGLHACVCKVTYINENCTLSGETSNWTSLEFLEGMEYPNPKRGR